MVEPAGEEGVASLGHRSGFFDACHTVVDDLEPDARSWVRRRLDLAASSEDSEQASARLSPSVPGLEPVTANGGTSRERRWDRERLDALVRQACLWLETPCPLRLGAPPGSRTAIPET